MTTPSWSSAKCFRFFLVEAFQHGLGDGASDLRLRAPAELVYQDEASLIAVLHHDLHVGQVRGVGAEVVLDGLLVAYIYEDALEEARPAVVQGDEQAALQHVLQQAHRLQAHGLAARVGARYDEDALLPVEGDVQGHHLLAVPGQGELEQGMDGRGPVYDLPVLQGGFQCLDVLCQQGLGADEVYLGQELVGQQHRRDGGAQPGGEFRQDADDFAPFVAFQLADAVVGFHHFGRLDEHGLSAGRLIVHDASYLALQGGSHRDDQASVAHGGRHVLVHHAFRLGAAQDVVQGARNASHRGAQLAPDACQFGRGIVLHLAVGGEDGVYLGDDVRKHINVTGQPFQAGIGGGFRFFLAEQEAHDVADGLQRAAQVEQLLFVQVHPFDADALQGGADIKEVLGRKVVFRPQQADKLRHLLQAFFHFSENGGKLHAVHPFLAERTEAFPFYQ